MIQNRFRFIDIVNKMEIDNYLNHDANDALDAHDENRFRTLFRRVSSSVPDGVLRFDTEKETGREAVNVGDARLPIGRLLVA